MNNFDSKIQQQFSELTTLLLQKRNAAGYWEGRLSSSALGVAVAVTALHFYDAPGNASEISAGLKWLATNINTDGGFGDSP
ncbi:MAG: squalene--hopene cyclase, partial [Bacteroidota bacterium]|nr:squalene--hopene cyclase [Bacteroidota bacterium]